ncbi:MAG: peptidoglycan recognition family protein [Planctomycetota bacterium]
MSMSVLRRSAIYSALVLSVFFSACSTMQRNPGRQSTAAPVLSFDYVFAPLRDDAELDLDSTPRSNEPAPHLRRAWVLLQRKRPQDAIDASALVLYGTGAPSPSAEAFARYIRAEAFHALGEPQKGEYDRTRARELALDERLRARLEDMAPLPQAQLASVKDAAAPAGSITTLSRSEWSPSQTIRSRLFPMGDIYRITVHHSAILLRNDSPTAAAGQLRSIQKTHMQEEGCGDIGYHFLIDPAGRVWQGRELRFQGAHARGGNNIGNIGVCVLGNFIRGREGQRPTREELASLERLIASLSGKYGISKNQIFCHSDLVATECPGAYLKNEVDRIARELPKGRSAVSRRGLPAE